MSIITQEGTFQKTAFQNDTFQIETKHGYRIQEIMEYIPPPPIRVNFIPIPDPIKFRKL